MGFAECLILLGVSYDSDDAVAWAERIMAFVAAEARAASGRLAEERGVFPNWARSVYAPPDERVRKGVTIYRYGSRARQVLTLGVDEDPTGREFFAKCDPGACRL